MNEPLRRILARSGAGPLRLAWVRLYELIARGVAWWLRRPDPSAAVYATSSLATGEIVPFVSDLDLAVVVPGLAAREALERRRDRLGPLARHVWVAVYDEDGLTRAQTPCLAQPEGTLVFGAAPLADDLELANRPSVPGRVHTWRRLSGPERRGARRTRSREEDRLAAWLELQAWWRWAMQACLDPGTPGRAALCVKLVAEPCRLLLWLERGEELPTRRAVLERARELVPNEREAIEDALDLQRRLAHSPRPPLERVLPVFLRLTQRIAARLGAELAVLETTPVRLLGGELSVPPQELAPLLPLADWRAIVAPTHPDECFAPTAGAPGDPAALAAAARAGSAVVYAALRAGDVLVLPSSDVYWLGKYRCAHFPGSDPVSFALLADSSVARFPQHRGWSIGDVAARAVAEHAAYLDAQLDEPGWEVEKLGIVLNALRAAHLAETLADGEPTLPLTLAATARAVGSPLAEEAAELHRRHRLDGGGPPVDAALRELADLARRLLTPIREESLSAS